MLIQFKVRNFRSLRDEQVLSFVASRDKAFADTHCVATGLTAVPALLRSCIVYGANASGKSTIIFALATLRNLVLTSNSLPDAAFAEQYTPFRLDRGAARAPTEFELTVLLDGVRYEYAFAYDAQRIRQERLSVYRTNKGQEWFERSWNTETTEYDWSEFSTHFKGQKDVWRRATRPQALFFSTAVQLNSEQLKPLFDWITTGMTILTWSGLINLTPTLQRMDDRDFKDRVLKLLRGVDIHIADIGIDKQPGHQVDLKFEVGKPPEFLAREQEVSVVKFLHKVPGEDDVWFDGRFESAGTQKLLAYMGPLLDALDNGKLLVIDELDSSLHPMVMRFVLDLVHSPDISKRGAQLLITTHDTSLLDLEVVRRDQIWFMEKDERQASKLFPLSDFSPRKNEALERGYLHGRYGAIPFLSRLDLH
jgi:hypothetical protein